MCTDAHVPLSLPLSPSLSLSLVLFPDFKPKKVFGKAKSCLQAGLGAGKHANEVVETVLEAVGKKCGEEVEEIRALLAETRDGL